MVQITFQMTTKIQNVHPNKPDAAFKTILKSYSTLICHLIYKVENMSTTIDDVMENGEKEKCNKLCVQSTWIQH